MELFDSHAHYDDARFETEFEGGAECAVRLSREAGVCGIVNAGTNVATSLSGIALSEKHDIIYAAVGIHPTDSADIPSSRSEDELQKIERLLSHEKVVAIGEIGLDYHYDNTDREKQKYFLEAQLEMAKRLFMPVIIHDRDAHGDCVEAIRKASGVRGIMHSFSGSAETVRELTALGWYISFSGTVSYKNAVNVRCAARAVPPDRLLIETDCPYLAPVPHRGKINYSLYLADTVKALAEATGNDATALARSTADNARRIFGIN